MRIRLVWWNELVSRILSRAWYTVRHELNANWTSMNDKTYRVIVAGAIGDGFERSQVIRNLSLLFKRDAAAVSKLVSGRPVVIRKDVDYETAQKVQKLLNKAGVPARVQRSTEPVSADTGNSPPEASLKRPGPKETVCPKCGYTATNSEDVLIVRGDCPRCGLVLGSPVPGREVTAESEDSPDSATPEISERQDPYADRIPASWRRRALAALSTFTFFLVVYCISIVLFILAFIPLGSVPDYLGRRFFEMSVGYAPTFFSVITILIVSFAFPIFRAGRSWGQDKLDIHLLYTKEAQVGGLYLSLAFRTVAICLVSFGPVLAIQTIASRLGIDGGVWGNALFILCIGASWAVSWLAAYKGSDKRSLLDLAGGTIQIEETVLPDQAAKKILITFGWVAGAILGIGVILPVFLKLFGI